MHKALLRYDCNLGCSNTCDAELFVLYLLLSWIRVQRYNHCVIMETSAFIPRVYSCNITVSYLDAIVGNTIVSTPGHGMGNACNEIESGQRMKAMRVGVLSASS